MAGVGPEYWHPCDPRKFAAGTSDFVHPFFSVQKMLKMDEDAEDGDGDDKGSIEKTHV